MGCVSIKQYFQLHLILRALCVVLLVCVCRPVHADGAEHAQIVHKLPLHLSNGQTRISFIGTFHSSDPAVTALTDAWQDTIATAQTVFVEIDPRTITAEIVQRFFFRENAMLRHDLSAHALAFIKPRVKRHLGRVNIDKLRPMTAYILASLPDEGTNGDVLDDVIVQRALKNGVQVVGLESPEEQYEVLYDLRDTIIIKLIEQLAREPVSTLDQKQYAIQRAYLAGDLERLFEFTMEVPTGLDERSHQAVEQYLDRLVHGRTALMWQRVREYIAAHELTNVVVAVGAGHLPSARGLLALARAEGYVSE